MINRDIGVFPYSTMGNHTLTYYYTIRHNPGTYLANANSSSRLPLPDKPDIAPVSADVQLMLNHLSECTILANQIKKSELIRTLLYLVFKGLLKLVA